MLPKKLPKKLEDVKVLLKSLLDGRALEQSIVLKARGEVEEYDRQIKTLTSHANELLGIKDKSKK